MLSNFEQNLEKYADVIVKVGLNLQVGQRLLIGAPMGNMYGAPIELAPLVRVVAAKAYQSGARLVDVMWDDAQLQAQRFQYAPPDSFEAFPKWRADGAYEVAQAGDSILLIYAENPDLLSGQDSALMNTALRSTLKHTQKFRDLRSQAALNYTIISAPVSGWTEKIFPDLSPEAAKAKFWDTIFDICRVKQDDPILAWEEHIKHLAARCDYLNQKSYDALKLTSPNTDLKVGLATGHIWCSGRLKSKGGIDYAANIPTEEVFTIPHKAKMEGVVRATKPLSYGGSLIEDFTLTFSEGRVIKATAKKGEESLHKLLEMDEGARRPGEIALVPHSSPISQCNRIFYNILIDENASNHIALGKAYRFNLEGGRAMTEAAFAIAGGNHSLIHVDFMVGSGEMDVDGLTKDGNIEAIMRGGEWAFDV